jgi:uncharacterized protein YjiS (DUF1127 family)
MLTLVRRQPEMTPVLWDKLIGLCRRACARAAAWHSQTREREALSRLDDRLLADIGLTREDQRLACSKLFWWIP